MRMMTRPRVVARSLPASIGLGCFLGGVAVLITFVILHTRQHAVPSESPLPSALPAGPDYAAEHERFDLVDMLPARAGGLRLIDATADKGNRVFPREFDQQMAVGHYDWIRPPGDRTDRIALAEGLALADMQLTCRRTAGDKIDCYERGAKKLSIANQPGCLLPEDRRCRFKDDGYFLLWPGCWMLFKCGAFMRGTPEDAAAIAADVERFASWFRGPHAGPPPPWVAENRVLLKAAMETGRR